ncbi:MAG: undecaprenyldiphospho-muramoylpentapeptide beta-N-acetylglucosaminyltransferase [Armatimonadetes bacterium]|nr:undecaprenyldiphospho-muramoylpentapeptide beta-N-acetylglucosaminyltransferase [Anaerolineae bacterium]
MLKRLLITAGGTGGHIYPALAVAEALLARHPDVTLAFVGSVDGFERPLIAKGGVTFASYDEVQSGPLHGIAPLQALVSVGKLALGTLQALGILRRRRPQVILATGGWCSFPIALAAWVLRIPLVIYLPDIEPGLTIKALRPFAAKVCVTAAESAPYFRAGQMVVTGYPLRQQMLNATRAAGIAHFTLDPARKTLLVFGGSRGARSLNTAVYDQLPALLQTAQVLHVTGDLDWERAAAIQATPGYHPYAYLHDAMGLAFAAADVVVCRSGASTLGELPYFGLASILVPYPYAWRYQKVNADYLTERGAALTLADELLADALLPKIQLLLDDPARLAQMQTQARVLARPDAAWQIAQTLITTGKA